MEVETVKERQLKPSDDISLGEQVASDLDKFTQKYKSVTFGIRTLSQRTGLNEKTIKRLIQRENSPTYQTVLKIYSTLLKETKYNAVLKKCPPVVAHFLQQNSPQESVANTFTNIDFYQLMQKEPLLGEIYVLAGTVTVNRKDIAYRFGQYGLEILEKLTKLGYLFEFKKDLFTIVEDGPNLDATELKYLGEYFVRKYSKPELTEERDNNLISFYCYGLNEEGKKQWLSIDTKAFYEKLSIAKQPKYQGKTPVFSFHATDTVEWRGDKK